MSGEEHMLVETMGLFGKTIYQCRHCETRSPDPGYFATIDCPPTIDGDDEMEDHGV